MQEIVAMARRIIRMLWLVLGILVAEIALTMAWQKPWADHFNNAQVIKDLYRNVSQKTDNF